MYYNVYIASRGEAGLFCKDANKKKQRAQPADIGIDAFLLEVRNCQYIICSNY